MTDVRLTATTTTGEVVYILANAKGELLLEEPIAPPEFDGNLDGDLTVSGSGTFPNITLRADGAIQATRDTTTASSGHLRLFSNVGAPGTEVFFVGADGTTFLGGDIDGGSPNITLSASGSAEFAGNVTSGGYVSTSDTSQGSRVGNGSITAQRPASQGSPGSTATFTSLLGQAKKARIFADGSAEFDGEVTIGSKGSKWLIRESNGVAMLIEQTRRGAKEPRIEDVRDLPRELDLVEAALNEIMGKLKMTPPAGWPVWDGSNNPDETVTGTP